MIEKTEAQLREAFDAEVAIVLKDVLPTDPPIYDAKVRGDVFAEMDRELANVALEAGHDVVSVARKVAARRLARVHGREVVRKAVTTLIVDEMRKRIA